MSRPSRDRQREPQWQDPAADAGDLPAAGAVPVDVRVTAAPAGAASGTPDAVATADGSPITAAPGEPVQAAVLRHLRGLARAAGHPVVAAVHDERIGFVVPLQVSADGSSRYAGEPVRTPPRSGTAAARPEAAPVQAPAAPAYAPPPVAGPVPPHAPVAAAPRPESAPAAPAPRRLDDAGSAGPAPASPPAAAPVAPAPAFVPTASGEAAEPVRPSGPATSAPSAPSTVPSPSAGAGAGAGPRQEPAPLPGGAATGIVPGGPAPAPLGEFGPAPVLDPSVELPPVPAPAAPAPAEAVSPTASVREPDPKPAPARGFDALAEAMLAPEAEASLTPASSRAGDGATAFSAEPVARINAAVRTGRIDEAAALAERTAAAAAQALGDEHPEVLRLRETTAYIAYLAGDALRSFHLSLDLARVRRRLRDAEGAYGNVQSAATAWRAVRDPLQGLHLGRDLIGVWTELAADGGPAADDIGPLESARTRMGRLAGRARALNDTP